MIKITRIGIFIQYLSYQSFDGECNWHISGRELRILLKSRENPNAVIDTLSQLI